MTQHQLVLTWIREKGSILPAKMAGIVYMGQMFGSETSKRCRELRSMGKLYGKKEGKFERFFLRPEIQLPPAREIKPEPVDTKQMSFL